MSEAIDEFLSMGNEVPILLVIFNRPEKNLIKKIGFDSSATHTKHANPVFVNLEVHPLEFPLRHPPFVYADGRPERNLEKALYYNLPFKNRCGQRLRHAMGMVKDFIETMPPIRDSR